jgi:hypothetical protein
MRSDCRGLIGEVRLSEQHALYAYAGEPLVFVQEMVLRRHLADDRRELLVVVRIVYREGPTGAV